VVQGKLVLKDAEGLPTILWELKKKSNDQVAFDPFWYCMQTIHYYGVKNAYRPFRATGFSEYTCLQKTTTGWCSVLGDLGWKDKEYVRRLRQAERMLCASDLKVGEYTSNLPVRLAPKRMEPQRKGETREEADFRAAGYLTSELLNTKELGGNLTLFDDDDVLGPPSPNESDAEDSAEEEERRETQAQWWNTSQYKASQKMQRVQEAIEDHRAKVEIDRLTKEDRIEKPVTLLARIKSKGASSSAAAKAMPESGRVSRTSARGSGDDTRARGRSRTQRRSGHGTREAEERADVPTPRRAEQPPVTSMMIDVWDTDQWVECHGQCGFWNVGTCNINYCCLACSKKAGNHGVRCRRLRVVDGRNLELTKAIGKCKHGCDPAVCQQCARITRPTGGEGWCEDMRYFKIGAPSESGDCQARFMITEPLTTGFTVADSSMQRMVDNPRPRLYLVQPDSPKARRVWVYSMPGLSILPGANDHNLSSWAVFWKMCGGQTNKVCFYVVPQKDSVQGNWGSAQRDKNANYIFQQCEEGVTILPTVREIINELGFTIEEVFFDTFHMTREKTKAIHNQYWKHIHELASETEKGDAVPVMIWDFNVSNRHLKEEHAQHVSFWNTAIKWGAASPDLKADYVTELNRMLQSDKPIDNEWVKKQYAHNRTAVIHYTNTSKVKMILDETQLPEDDEYDDRLCPGWMPGRVKVERGVLSSRWMAEEDAMRGKWFPDTDVRRWRATIGALLEHLHGSVDREWWPQDWIDKRFESADGQYRMFFAALLRQYGISNANPFVQTGRDLS